jgi:uncharacterized protein (DUF427 family)
MKAIWNDTIIAESDNTVIIEGNHYFSRESVDFSFLKPSSHTSACPWKGLAHYYSVEVNGEVNTDAAWYYPEPKPAASEIKDHLAFWRGVNITS